MSVGGMTLPPAEIAPFQRVAPDVAGVLVSVVMPVYNEAGTIREILRRVAATPLRKEVIVVDDGSVDGTRNLLAELQERGLPDPRRNQLRVILQPQNRGKGAALRAGFAAVRGEVVVIQDADLEYDPADYPILIRPILDGRADAVYGSRFLGSSHRVLFFWHMVGNKLLTLLSNMLTDLNLTDMETGAKAFRADVIKNMPLRSDRFGFEPEVTAKLARMRARIYEVPASYSGRGYSQGKKINWKDGVEAVWTMLRLAFARQPRANHPIYAALRRIESNHRYNAWIWEKVGADVGERVLEIAPGVPNLTNHLLTRKRLVIADADEWYLRLLHNTYGEGASNIDTRPFDLVGESPFAAGEFDTVLCLNGLERLDDDVAALRRLRDALADGGRLIVVVPALRSLYGTLDRSLGRHRRYERHEIERLLDDAGFRIERVEFANVPGAVGWFVASRLLRRAEVSDLQGWLNDRLVYLMRLETWLRPRWGLSLLAVARKEAGV